MKAALKFNTKIPCDVCYSDKGGPRSEVIVRVGFGYSLIPNQKEVMLEFHCIIGGHVFRYPPGRPDIRTRLEDQRMQKYLYQMGHNLHLLELSLLPELGELSPVTEDVRDERV